MPRPARTLAAAAVALALALPAGSARAATVLATSVDQYVQGAGVVPARAVTANALGAADGRFLSLGLGGSATFGFGTRFSAPGAVVEVTFGDPRRAVESVDIYGLIGGVRSLLGSLTNLDDGTFRFTGVFDQLQFVDTTTAGGRGRDGYDIDAISVTPAPIPLPAAGSMLLIALGGLALMRRRRA